jgi:hypothetical protein
MLRVGHRCSHPPDEHIKGPLCGVDCLDMSTKIMRLRRPDRCASCGGDVPAGTQARWDSEARTVTCHECVHGVIQASVPPPASATEPATAPPPGIAGASALREYERRQRNREDRTRARHPHIGGLLLALREPPQHERAWRKGARGEAAVAAALEKRTAEGRAVLLYDRRIPGGRANIDLLAVAATGVYVIDAKAHKGKVSIATPLIGKPRLTIAGRESSALLDGLDRQVAAVRAALGALEVPSIHGVLCFTEADLPLLGRTVRSHRLLYPKQLAKRINSDGPWAAEQINAAAATLAAALPPA